MKIVVNTRFLLKKKLEGFGWFTYETFKRITQQHPEHEFIFLFDRPYDEQFIFSDNITPVVIGPPARHPVLFYIWFEYAVKRMLKKHQPDVFISPDGYLCLGTATKSIAVIHDLNFEHYPEDLPYAHRKYYTHFFPKFARKADRIITVSNFSKQDIVKQYNIAASKIDVAHNGVNEMYQPSDEATQQAARQQFTNGAPYFIYVGALHARKNIHRLFQAFEQFKKTNNNDVKLLVVGQKMFGSAAINNAYEQMEHQQDVVFTGRLSNEDLNKALGAAMAMTYVSYFEGFGIPVAEAMQCHTPVITSNVTSLPEVAGDAALLVDPFSVDAIANAMTTMWKDEALRQELVEKGKAQVAQFSWQHTADNVWQSICKTANHA